MVTISRESTFMHLIIVSIQVFHFMLSLQKIWSEKQGHKVDAWQSAVSGAVSGTVAMEVS